MKWSGFQVIKSLKKQTIKPSKIILVDNASTDGSQEYAMEQGCYIVNYDKSEFNLWLCSQYWY